MNPGSTVKTKLNIHGMTCASCVRHVEKALLKVPGVSQASVNLATESAFVESSPDLDTQLLIQSVTDAGYEADMDEPVKKNS